VADDTPPGTYSIGGTAVTDEEKDTGVTTITVEADGSTGDGDGDTGDGDGDTGDGEGDQLTAQRAPGTQTVAPGESVSVTVELSAGGPALNVTSEEVRTGSEFLNFTNVNSAQGSADVDNKNGSVSVLYINAPSSDTLTYTVEVAEDTPLGTYNVDGTAVTNQSVPTGTTTITVEEEDTAEDNQLSVDRTPESVTAQPGDTVDVSIGLTANGAPLNVTSEEIQSNLDELNFTSVSSEEGAAAVDNENGTISVLYINQPSSDTLTYTVELADDVDPGTYSLGGNAVTNQDISTGTTTITVPEPDSGADDGDGGDAGDGGDGDAGDGGDGDAGDGGDGDAGDGGDGDAGDGGDGDAGGGGGGLVAPDQGLQPAGPQDVQRDADVTLASAEISDRLVSVGDRVEVEAVFQNDGDEPGEIQADLTSEGELVTSKAISVEADSTRTVSFTIQAAEAGEFGVSVNDRSLGSVTVLGSDTPTATPDTETPVPDGDDDDTDDEPQDTDSPTDTETSESPSTTSGGQPGFGIVAVILALGAGIMLVRRR
jgi:PGF-CTERM protein